MGSNNKKTRRASKKQANDRTKKKEKGSDMIGQTLTTQQQYASQNRLILHGVERSEPEGRQDRVYIRQVGGVVYGWVCYTREHRSISSPSSHRQCSDSSNASLSKSRVITKESNPVDRGIEQSTDESWFESEGSLGRDYAGDGRRWIDG